MSAAGAASPAPLAASDVRARLEANRAKVARLRSMLAGSEPQKTPTMDPNHVCQNPIFTEDSTQGPPSPTRKVGGVYTPRFADAIRSTPSRLLGDEAHLPPCGSLFAADARIPPDGRQATYPRTLEWDVNRLYLTGDFLMREATTVAPSPQTPALSLVSQERLVSEELLNAFMGVPGDYIRPRASRKLDEAIHFELLTRDRIESGVQEMVVRMLPVCEYAAVVRRFVEVRSSPSWGRCSQGLAGALRALIQDWHLMVAQLETQMLQGKLTLQALWYYVQPPATALREAAEVCCLLSNKGLRGARLLDLLNERASASIGDARARALLRRLLAAAAEPYFQTLRRWLAEGVLDDPAREFFVAEDPTVRVEDVTQDGKAAFWQSRWTLRVGAAAGAAAASKQQGEIAVEVPAFLRAVARPVLDAGRYLNVLRACDRTPPRVMHSELETLAYDDTGRYLQVIRAVCTQISGQTMDVLRKECGLLDGLRALKMYFLTAQGDLFGNFMDAAETDLGISSNAVSLPLLQSFFDAAVRSSCAATDPAASTLRVSYDSRTLLNMLIDVTQASSERGSAASPPRRTARSTPLHGDHASRARLVRESLMISCPIPWPVSIIATQSAMDQYKMVFRHLWELRWVERELTRVWRLYMATAPLANLRRRSQDIAAVSRALGGSNEAAWRALSEGQAVCQLASHFFRQTLLYMTFEVIEPLWRTLEARLLSARALDDVVAEHTAFLRCLLKGCLLSRKVVVLRTLLSLKDLALQFVRVSDRFLDVSIDGPEDTEEDGSRGKGSSREAHAARTERAAKRQAALLAALGTPEYGEAVSSLRTKFAERMRAFMAELAEARRAAILDGIEPREELDGLSSLILRLDLNGHYHSEDSMDAAV